MFGRATRSTRYALCIGINDYPGTGNDLKGCVNDAMDWADALVDRSYQVKVLLNSAATKAAIVRQIAEIVAVAKRGDRFVLTFSCHGTWVPDKDGDEADGRDEALVPYDFRDYAKGGLLKDDELQALLEPAISKGVRVVILSDSCHSGSVSRWVMSSKKAPRFLSPSNFLPPSELPAAVRAQHSRATSPPRTGAVLISGCADKEVSYDVQEGRPHGAFTAAALATLPAAKSYAGWHKAILKRLPNDDTPQTPQLTATLTQRYWKPLL